MKLAEGARDVGRGLEFLRRYPRLWKWVIAPAVIALALLVAIVATVIATASSLIAAITDLLPSWLAGVGSWLLWIVLGGALVIGGLLVFVSVVGVVAGPFNELLSEAVEQQATGRAREKFSVAAFLRGAAIGVVHGIRRVVVSLLGLVLVFALGFVPVVGTIVALLLGGWLAARGAAYDCYDAVLSRRSMSYADKLAYLAAHRDRSFGLGAAIAGMLLVPGLNLVALGIGATGATLAALEIAGERVSS